MSTYVVVVDELSEVGDGEGVVGSGGVQLTVVLDDAADPALELGHRLVELTPLERHVLELDAASAQLRHTAVQTRRQLTLCIQHEQRRSSVRPSVRQQLADRLC